MGLPVYFVSLVGDLDVKSIHEFQNKVVKDYVVDKDINLIFGFNLSPTISFGGNKNINSFASGKSFEDVEKYGLNFYSSNRPGGTTYLGPGQRTYFLNIGIGSPKKVPNPTFDFGHKLLDLIVDLSKSLPCNNSYVDSNNLLCESQTDLFYQHGDKKSKLGSLGIKGECVSYNLKSKLVTKYGVNFNLSNEGLKHFDIINPCGIVDKNINVGCLEELLNVDLEVDFFDKMFLQSFEKMFPFETQIDEYLSSELQQIYDEISNKN